MRRQRNSVHLFVLFAVALGALYLGYFGGREIGPLFTNGDWLAKVFAAASGIIFGLSLFGFALYALRSWNRLIYGILEICFACLTILAAVSIHFLREQPDGGFVTWLDNLPIAAGVYVFVRGMDNIGEVPECLDDYIPEDNPIRLVDAFVEELELRQFGW